MKLSQTNERTIAINWIGLTSFQISENGERCKSVKHADAEPEDAAGDPTQDSGRRGFASREEKKGCRVLNLKHKTALLYSLVNCTRTFAKLRDTVKRRIDHYYYYFTYYLSIFICWQDSRDYKDIESMEIVLMHYKSPKSVLVTWFCNEEACSWMKRRTDDIAREKLYSITETKSPKYASASIFIIVRNHRSNNAE